MRAADEAHWKGPKGPKANGAGTNKSKGCIVTFSPTKEQKEMLKSGILDEAKSIEVLDRVILEGNKVSLGYSSDRNGFYAITRDGNPDWQKTISVSAWGSTLSRAMISLAYYHREVNPGFPEGVQLPMFSDEW